MSTVSKAMLKECLLESILAEIKEIEAMDYAHINASEEFKERVKSTITAKKKTTQKFHPKKIAIAIVAAILVSISIAFTASAELRHAVADFFVKAYETFTQFIIADNDKTDTSTPSSEQTQDPITYPTTIETEYIPSYVIENNYVEIDKIVGTLEVFTIWSNDYAIIDLSQHIMEESGIILDTENSPYQTAYIGEQKVYYTLKNAVYTILWLANGYSFNMSCDEALGWEEVEKIVLSLEPVTD